MESLDQLWVLLCAALVFLMQAGFMCVEAGITRTKNSISVAIKNIADFSLSVLLYMTFGYALMFGSGPGWPFSGLGETGYAPGHDATVLIFQAMFCGTAATILSGAVAERCSFHAYIALAAITAGLIYPVFGHWAWATDATGAAAGWLGALGYHDHAGAGVVHALGGGAALAAVLVIGPRDGRFLEGGGARRFNGSNLPMAMLGILLLWFGWIGFNGGSALRFGPEVGGVILNTLAGGAAGVLSGLAVSSALTGKPSVFFGMNGALGGLVSVTAGCDVFTLPQAVMAGAVGGAVVYGLDQALERLRIDDAVGAVPVHLGCGIWGLLAVWLFAGGQDGISLLAQLAGIGALLGFCVAVPYAVFRALDAVMPLRVSSHVETIGLNVGEHGANTDLNELFEVMQRQARERDLSIRAPQSPFTEIGQIGLFYNSVMYELEQSFQRIQRQEAELTEAVQQRTSLLESILPRSIANRMNGGEDQIVDQFADGTVVFIDVVDFTTRSMEGPPQRSMEILRDLFGAYDRVVDRYEVEKIKTIGDCYMFVAGIPTANPDHCEAAVDAALEILFETRQAALRLAEPLQVRIGVHSGPLIAGVVGDFRFVYDLWGSTVNTASRIEEAAQPGTVTVSQAVIDRVGPIFTHQRRGRVRLRSIGPSVLYTIEGRKIRASRSAASPPPAEDARA